MDQPSLDTQVDRQVFSVGQINSLAKDMLETISVWVEGEVSEFKGANGRYFYLYFTLKDTTGDFGLPAVVVRHSYQHLGGELINGQKILAYGKLSLFTKSGSYQFIVSKIQVAGAGALAAQLEKLKLQLQKEGLLDQERKRPLPDFPQRIGVITSIVSDAWADFQRHTVAKFPCIELVVADAYVQGPKAPASLLRALQALQEQSLDLIVITRGGGSAEDLAAFNDEPFVRAIAASSLPTLVAVGHEKDVSIADLVADIRASTPTNAGQLITRGYEDALVDLQHLQHKLIRLYQYQTDSSYQQLDHLLRSLNRLQNNYQTLPLQLTQLQQQLAYQVLDLLRLQQKRLDQAHAGLSSIQQLQRILPLKLEALDRQLQAINPLNVLSRGYSMVTHNGSVVTSVQQLQPGDTIDIRLHQGRVAGQITELES